jgi:hypothetical protein
MSSSTVGSVGSVVPAITYQILYKDVSMNSIDFAKFSFNSTNTDKTFKDGLKSLLETKDAKLFIGELLFVAENNDVNDLSGSQLPFIFAIDTINDKRSQRTYLTFTGTSSVDAKVNFIQYNVETTIKPAMDEAFQVLIEDNYKYSYYNDLLQTPVIPAT